MISVVIPVKNAEQWLGRSLRSLYHQTYKDVEVIAIDGGSTDTSVDILRKYPTSMLIVKQDKSPNDATRLGFSLAKGDIMGWHMADDELAINYLEEVAKAFEDPTVQWVYAPVDLVDDSNNLVFHKMAYEDITLESMLSGNFFVSLGVFFRKEFFNKVGGLAELDFTDDHDLWFRMMLASKPKRLTNTYCTFHKTGQNRSIKNATENQEIVSAAMDKVFKKYQQIYADSQPKPAVLEETPQSGNVS